MNWWSEYIVLTLNYISSGTRTIILCELHICRVENHNAMGYFLTILKAIIIYIY